MKKFFPLLFGTLLVIGSFACTPKTSTANPEPEESEETPLAFSTPQPDFTTTVVEADLPSPRKEMTGELNGVNVTINYGSPATKGRAIWGSLVPYGEVWRTGANEATRFTIDQDIVINEQPLAAGTYSLFTVPGPESWEVIFNATADQWGAYEYDPEKDVLRVDCEPIGRDSVCKHLEFVLVPDALQLEWERLVLPISFTKS